MENLKSIVFGGGKEGNMVLCDSRGFVERSQWRGEDFEIIGNAHFDPPREEG